MHATCTCTYSFLVSYFTLFSHSILPARHRRVVSKSLVLQRKLSFQNVSTVTQTTSCPSFLSQLSVTRDAAQSFPLSRFLSRHARRTKKKKRGARCLLFTMMVPVSFVSRSLRPSCVVHVKEEVLSTRCGLQKTRKSCRVSTEN